MQITQTIVNRNLPSYLTLICQSANSCFQESIFSRKKTVEAEYDLKGKSILVIDNNRANHLFIKLITKKWMNTMVDFAANGKEGLKKLSRNNYDLILMDLNMPVMDGYQTTMAIRRGKGYEKLRTIPIIALTKDAIGNTKELALQIGMDQHLEKPVNEKRLFESISALVTV